MDRWAEWILKNRFGSDPEMKRRTIEGLSPIRDKVIENAHLDPGKTLLDVGCGDGFIGFKALENVQPGGRVILSDISESLIDVCREFVSANGLESQTECLVADATDLSAIPDASVDAVTTRSVLIYVADKPMALREFFRVLKPGGWLSIFEPVAKVYNSFKPEGVASYMGFNLEPVKHLMPKLFGNDAQTNSAQSTMSDFDDRDMIRMIREAGFDAVETELRIHSARGANRRNWEAFYTTSPNPLVATFKDRVEAALSTEEITELVAYLKPLVESNDGETCDALLYVTARKENWKPLTKAAHA